MAVDNFKNNSLTANGSVTISPYLGKGLTFSVFGTFGSGNVVIESSSDDITWDEELASQTANFKWTVGSEIPRGLAFRARLQAASGTTLTIRTFVGRG